MRLCIRARDASALAATPLGVRAMACGTAARVVGRGAGGADQLTSRTHELIRPVQEAEGQGQRIETDDRYGVDCFKARHLKGGQPKYLVHWKVHNPLIGRVTRTRTPRRNDSPQLRGALARTAARSSWAACSTRSSPSYRGGGASIGTGWDGLGASGKGASVGEEAREGSGEGETQRRVSGTCGTANLVVS